MSAAQREALHTLLRNGPLDVGGELAEQRVLLDELMTSHPLPGDVTTADGRLGGIPVVEIRIDALPTDSVILYLHGGAYALGSAAAAAGLASEIARRSDARAISVDYRLAPEHPYPAALNDVIAAYRGIIGNAVPASRIAVVGESAGAGLAVAALVAFKKVGLPQPSAAVLLSPWVDLSLSGESMTTKAGVDPALTGRALATRAVDYAAGVSYTDPCVSPLFAELAGLPPLLIQVGTNEILLDDATRLATRAAHAGVATTLEVTPDVPHVFQGFAALLDEGEAALTSVGTFLVKNWNRQ